MGPIAKSILQDMLADPNLDYLKAPRFAAELHAWAVAEARTRLLSDIGRLAEGASDDSGIGDLAEGARVAWALLHRCEARAMSGRDRRSAPAAAARLGRDRTAANLDVALIMAQLHRLEQAGVDVSGDGVDSDG